MVRNIIDLRTDRVIKYDNKEFVRLIDDSGEIFITTKQVAKLLGRKVIHVNERIKYNLGSFISIDCIIDLKNIICDNIIFDDIGYTNMMVAKSKNIYCLTYEGFLLYLQIADIKKDYSDFEYLYFKKESLLTVSHVRYESSFGYTLSNLFKCDTTFIPQYPCCNNKYRIDFYSDELRLAIEYDEEHHKYNKSNDAIREKEIINELKCEFIRVKKGYELDGLKNIIEKINKLKNNKHYLKNKFKIKGDNKDEK